MSDNQITTSKKLARNTFFNMLTLVINSAIGFFMIRFFLGQLGENRYGIWVLVGSIFRYRSLFGLGLNSAINRYVPVYLAKNNNKGIQQVISTSFFFFIALAILIAIAAIVVHYNVGSWFVIKPDLVTTASMVVLIVGFCSALALPLQLSEAVLSGLQRYDIINIMALIPLLLRTVLLVVLLLQNYGLIAMGFVFGISEIGTRVLQFICVKKLLPHTTISLKIIDFKLLKAMLAYGINTFLYTTGAFLIFKVSDLIIGIFIGTAEISQFAIATACVLLLSLFLQSFTAAIKPAVSDLDARDKHSQVLEIAFLMQKYSLLLLIPAGCFLLTMGKEFITIWVGEKFHSPSAIDTISIILAILTIGHCLRLAQQSNFLVLVGLGDHKIFGILTALMAVSVVILAIISVRIFNMGLIGIAWANFVPMVLTSVLILPIYFNWKMKISTRQSLRRVWWPAILGTLPTVIIINTWKYLAPPNSWLEIVAVVIAATTVTFISSWFLSIDAVERKRFIKILGRK